MDMTTFYGVIGGVSFLAGAIILCGLMVRSAVRLAIALLRIYDARVEAFAAREIGKRLHADAWWFSEDEPTRVLLQSVGMNLLRGDCPTGDINQLREQWRRDRAALASGEVVNG